MKSITGILITAAVILGVIYAFNRWSGKNVASFGTPA